MTRSAPSTNAVLPPRLTSRLAATIAALALAAGCSSPEVPAPTATPPTDAGRAGSATAGPGDGEGGTDGAARGELALVVVAELDQPIDAAALADGTVLVAERPGRVVAIDASGRVSDPLLDLTDRTTTDGERGLLSLAVREDGGLLVVSFTDRSGDTTLEAYPLDGARLDAAGRRTLWSLAQPYANHNGGAVRFGPDGMLYLALGDGGGSEDPLDAGQDRSTPLGSLVRLDVSGSGPARVPADNPFVGVAGAAPEIAATGLRNPWRFTFDPVAGEVWIADVGQGRREEIDRVAFTDLLGANFGWARLEGSLPLRGDPPAEHVLPVHEYDHGPGCSVTGGIVYRGARLPWLTGAYLHADLCDGTLRALLPRADGTLEPVDLGVAGRRVVGFAEDADGEVLVLDLEGSVSRLVPR